MGSTLSCLATSLADDPETSIQVFENSAQAVSMNTKQKRAWNGLAAMSAKLIQQSRKRKSKVKKKQKI